MYIKESLKIVRKPAVSGMFYPADPIELRGIINKLLMQAKSRPLSEVHGIIVPHAGYQYSGRVAAEVYNILKGQSIRRIVLIGPSHHLFSSNGPVIDTADFWETPLGLVKLYKGKEYSKNCTFNDKSHEKEHSLEVQLPFLQRVLGNDFELIPIVCGSMTMYQIEKLAEELAEMPADLFIFSTDLSHYLPYDTAKMADKRTISAIERLDTRLSNDIDACGKIPILVAMELCKRRKWKMHLVKYENSGDVIGDKSRVVGYAGFWF